MNLYLVYPPSSQTPDIAGFRAAHMIYKVRGSKLYIAKSRRRENGGAMVVTLSELSGGAPSSALIGEIVAEAETYDYDAVVLDSSERVTPLMSRTAEELAHAVAPKPVYVPENLAASAPSCRVLIQTALSGGYLTRHLATAIDTYGRSRVALEVDRVVMDFTLPALNGAGQELSLERAESLRNGRPLFFSDALCVFYFIYFDGTAPHIVLYDDDMSINSKLALAEDVGITDAFLYYPQVRGLINGIRPR
ncbi:MAG: hypothetical protein LBN02_03685 [Oscillospiraceae bacterium]|jgi:hypothetical protein|nr:hypothetical protein [Oscillospiraceae bacterium]